MVRRSLNGRLSDQNIDHISIRLESSLSMAPRHCDRFATRCRRFASCHPLTTNPLTSVKSAPSSSRQLQSINERTVLVGCINDLFSLVVLSTNEEPSVTLGRLGDQLGIGQELILLHTNGTLSKIKGSNAHPRKKLEDFVDALTKQVPSISDLLTRSFE